MATDIRDLGHRDTLDRGSALTTRLCRENQTVVIEDLRMAFMFKNRHLARAASDMGLGEFDRQMRYKAPFPSTRMCSGCGELKDMPLSERTYRCPRCGLVLPRDLNAAINLERLSTPGFGGIHACGQEGSGPSITRERNHVWMKQELTEYGECVVSEHFRTHV